MLPTPDKKVAIIFDVETYFDKEYSLRKMPTPNYILDPRFELQMVAVKVIDLTDKAALVKQVLSDRFNPAPLEEHQIIDGPDFEKWLTQFDPALTTTISFNSLFDNSILAWRYGFVPHTMIDAMGVARALLGHELTSFSLKAIADYMHLGAKGTALQNMMGKRREQIIQEGLWPSFCQYALQDNHLCEQIFLRLYPQFPWSERRLMDMVLRCTVEPRFRVDVPMLEQHLIDVRAAKAQLLVDANNVDPKIIMSTPKFKAALEARGVEVEMKVSPTTGKETPCFAKTDEFMELLQDHADPVVAAMAAARIGLKSTLEETRTDKLLSIATQDWSRWHAGQVLGSIGTDTAVSGNACFMPMPLRYGGAHTHRLSGEWGMNMQNMPTVRGSKGKSKLRQSLIVGPDETVVTCDLSQIEARLSAWICGCGTLIDEFANKKDPYSQLATDIFGYPVNRKLKHPNGELIFPIEGFIGKTGILGLGYGAGKDKFDTMVIQTARKDGLDISKIYSRPLGDKAVDTYRRRYHEIPRGWWTLEQIIRTAWLSGSASQKFGPVTISYGSVLLPSGLSLRYAEPGQRMGEDGRTEYVYRYGKFWHKLYGAKFLENIVQALARIVVMNAALRIRDRGLHTANPRDYFFSLQAHDELVFIVKTKYLDDAKRVILEEMIRRPSWAPTAPIDAELGQGASYGAAK
jgi:DNA polymerase family A